MATKKFSDSDWKKIMALAESSAEDFGLPAPRRKSVVIGSFNIRKLGTVKNRSPQAWDFLEMISERFDLLAVQEVTAGLAGIRELKRRLGPNRGLVISDTTGVFPGDRGNPERLAFLFDWTRVERTELASDITYDRSKVLNTLGKAQKDHEKRLKAWRKEVLATPEGRQEAPPLPGYVPPEFVTFIRQPHCASFKVPGRGGAAPYEFLVVNAHLLYGEDAGERKAEFNALIEWLTIRTKSRSKLYHKNILLLGDCNLEFEDAEEKRSEVDDFVKKLNTTRLKSKRAAKANFPLLTAHPKWGALRTNARQEQTYDQIGLFSNDSRLPAAGKNEKAGEMGADGYDYGVFMFTDLFAAALHGKKFKKLTQAQRDNLIERCEHDVSDHMPAWIRLPVPGA